jgi:hypothetical protein
MHYANSLRRLDSGEVIQTFPGHPSVEKGEGCIS